jgi:hypothetical protein
MAFEYFRGNPGQESQLLRFGLVVPQVAANVAPFQRVQTEIDVEEGTIGIENCLSSPHIDPKWVDGWRYDQATNAQFLLEDVHPRRDLVSRVLANWRLFLNDAHPGKAYEMKMETDENRFMKRRMRG